MTTKDLRISAELLNMNIIQIWEPNFSMNILILAVI